MRLDLANNSIKAKGDASALIAKKKEVEDEAEKLKPEIAAAEKEVDKLLKKIGNLVHPSVPVSKDEVR